MSARFRPCNLFHVSSKSRVLPLISKSGAPRKGGCRFTDEYDLHCLRPEQLFSSSDQLNTAYHLTIVGFFINSLRDLSFQAGRCGRVYSQSLASGLNNRQRNLLVATGLVRSDDVNLSNHSQMYPAVVIVGSGGQLARNGQGETSSRPDYRARPG